MFFFLFDENILQFVLNALNRASGTRTKYV